VKKPIRYPSCNRKHANYLWQDAVASRVQLLLQLKGNGTRLTRSCKVKDSVAPA